MAKKILLIGNPAAGGGRAMRTMADLPERLRQRGHRVETFLTRSAGDAGRRARDMEGDVDALVIVGGDGTINEILNGLADPSRIPIAHLPTGTASILGRELGLPRRTKDLVRLLESGHLRQLDMGLLDGRRFLMVASAGFDAMVTEEVGKRRGGTLGYLGYLSPILRVLSRYHPPELQVTIDGAEPALGALVVVSNTRNYGGIFSFADRARCDSGHLDVCIFPRGSLPALIWYYLAAFCGWVSKRTDVRYLTGTRIKIESKDPVAVQVDGDYAGTTPAEIQLLPALVPVLVP
ncbi:MAG: diacylglycerol kinase family lipid kinase [candidate division NC10 bacterium]|nr:diacylglycerol kinase family lipid kinase [candidate division NC10 bacterium]